MSTTCAYTTTLAQGFTISIFTNPYFLCTLKSVHSKMEIETTEVLKIIMFLLKNKFKLHMI
jgi:hypothetical protein